MARILRTVVTFLLASALRAQVPEAEVLRGDANNDTFVDSSDPIFINNYLFSGGSTPSCLDAADANDDGQVDVSDSSYLVTFLFLGGPAPPAPYPVCDGDPTGDSLSCSASLCT